MNIVKDVCVRRSLQFVRSPKALFRSTEHILWIIRAPPALEHIDLVVRNVRRNVRPDSPVIVLIGTDGLGADDVEQMIRFRQPNVHVIGVRDVDREERLAGELNAVLDHLPLATELSIAELAASTSFELRIEVTTDSKPTRLALRLADSNGVHLSAHQVRLEDFNLSKWEGVFNTFGYVRKYADSALIGENSEATTVDDLLEEIGVFIGQSVLGTEIMQHLLASKRRRALVIRLPPTIDELPAAILARVPWEIARPRPGEAPLMERALVVRITTEDSTVAELTLRSAAETLAKRGGIVRVLLVFAEIPGSRPLAMRWERERLRELFEEEILPHYGVEFDVLCHGVTRQALLDQIIASGGYDIVHWSGHGHFNQLELLGEDGRARSVTGQDLVALFTETGGLVPQLFFLSACHSGPLASTEAWTSLQRAPSETAVIEETKQIEHFMEGVLDLKSEPGYARMALSLLHGGVPQVVAMRSGVSDSYARELSYWFFKRLFGPEGKTATDALAQARVDVLREHPNRMTAVDHANPLVFGVEGVRLPLTRRRSRQMRRLRPRPQPLLRGGSRELERRDLFVGRGSALTRINRAWRRGGAAVTVVQGMGGLGKTALASEAIYLWHPRFDWVLAFQAKPTALVADDFLRRVDTLLTLESAVYREKIDESPFERIYLEPNPRLYGDARYERMIDNLLEALRSERLLLVLDNFERNLQPAPGEESGYACADPRWDELLTVLRERLPGTESRLLILSRHRPRALAGDQTLWVVLGPLPPVEAVLFVRNHEGLSRLLYDQTERSQELLRRVLRVSQGHPLMLERFGTLADDHEALRRALERLEKDGMRSLSTLTDELTDNERVYLEDVVETSVDILLERQPPDARRLLWVVSLAYEPVTEELLAAVWSGRSEEEQQMLQVRALLQNLDQLPEGLLAQLEAIPPELRHQLEALDPGQDVPMEPLLASLYQAGLLTREQPVPTDAQPQPSPSFGCHELVRERVEAWMGTHPDERGGRTATQVWVGYGRWYAADYQHLQMSGAPWAREAATEAGRRALVYLVRAGEYGALGSFASSLVTGTSDPGRLGPIIAELRAVADQVPVVGEDRWRVWTYLADALRGSGQPEQALPLYEVAAAEAEQAEHWADAAVIFGNWANALGDVGQLEAAQATVRRSIEAKCKAGSPAVEIVGSELESLRIDVMRGRAQQVWPDIETRLTRVRSWWAASEAGTPDPEAPNREFLGRVLVSVLDIARQTKRVLEQWQDSLDLLEEIEATDRAMGESKHQLAFTRFNQYFPLLRLGRLEEAQCLLEGCLEVFRTAGDLSSESKALSALADLWKERGDLRQATALERKALAVKSHLPDPESRAISHNNLSNTLERLGDYDGAAEHLLAAMAYYLVSGHRGSLSITLRNLANNKRQAVAEGRSYTLPRLPSLLAKPAFHPLQQFLHGTDLPALQATIDQLEAKAEHASTTPATPSFTDLPPEPRRLLAPLFQAAAKGEDVDPVLAELRTQLR